MFHRKSRTWSDHGVIDECDRVSGTQATGKKLFLRVRLQDRESRFERIFLIADDDVDCTAPNLFRPAEKRGVDEPDTICLRDGIIVSAPMRITCGLPATEFALRYGNWFLV